MTKYTSTMLIAAVAGIMIAGALVVALPNAAFATACNGGIGKLGESGGIGVSGGTNNGGNHNSQLTNGKKADGGNGGDANGGNAC